MDKPVWCIPNFSEGCRKDVVEEIVDEIRAAAPVQVLDWSMDADHNRSVVTFVGEGDHVRDAVLTGARTAVKLIDLNTHSGCHPRIGAVDVVPLVPIGSTTMQECIELGHCIGREIGETLGIPVYFYERCALRQECRNLAAVRAGGFESLRYGELTGERRPDAGPNVVHPTAGASVVGARPPLIAFNVNLNSSELESATAIAREIRRVRESGQGMIEVRAIGVLLKSRGMAQVSTNITRPDLVRAIDVYSFIEREAIRKGIGAAESELIGVVQEGAVTDNEASVMKLVDFGDHRVLERMVKL